MGTAGICVSTQCKSKLLLISPSPALMRGKGLSRPVYIFLITSFVLCLLRDWVLKRPARDTTILPGWPLIEEALSRPKERIRWQRWDMLIIHKNVKVLNTSEAARSKGVERCTISRTENTDQTKSGKYSIPVQAHQQRKSLHKAQPGGLSLWVRDSARSGGVS